MNSALHILATGRALPSRRVSNDQMASLVDTSDEWITTRTGIRQRYFCAQGESAATLAATGCRWIQSEPGALLCYHNPSGSAEGDHRGMRRAAEALRNARDCVLEVYTARGGAKTREELIALMDKDVWITPTQAREYGLVDEIVGAAAAEEDPAAFVASAGRHIRLTAAMREKYQAHVAEQRAEQARKEQASRALTRIRALANF